jgi:hypothetical protein
MTGNNWLILAAALVVWAVIFYAMDRYIMASQGLPVGANMMPL